MIKKTVFIGVLLSVLMTGCTTVPVKKQINETSALEKKPSNIVNSDISRQNYQSKNLKIKDDSVYYLNNINQGSIPLIDTPVTLIFIEEEGLKNVAKGFSGCNDYYFKYQVSSNILVLGEVVTTNFKCGKNEAIFENFLFNELGKDPEIRVNNDYVVIKGHKNEFFWKKKYNEPKSVRKVISSTSKNEERDVVAYTEVEQSIYERDEVLEIVKENKIYKRPSNFKKEINEHKGVLVDNENIKGLLIYKKSLSMEANQEVKDNAILIKNKLGGNSKIMNVNLKSGDAIPLIEYRVKRNDTLKKIILTTYPEGSVLNWVDLISRLRQLGNINKNIENLDNIYPNQKIFVPVFKN